MTRLRFLAAGALACAAAVSLSACNTLAGFNTALAPNLKPLAISIAQPMRCSDLADRTSGADDQSKLSGPQLRAMYRACEEMQENYALMLDPQGARKALDTAIKGVSSPTAAAAKVVGGP